MAKYEGEIPECVITGLEEVRQSGKYNMFSGNEVFTELFKLGHFDAVVWLVKEDPVDHCNGCEDDCDHCLHDKVQLDFAKYTAALHELGQILALPDILANS